MVRILQEEKGTPEERLSSAAYNDDKPTVVALIKAGTNVNCRDESQWTPLHRAAEQNVVDVAKILVAHGAELNARDEVSLSREYKEKVCVCVCVSNIHIYAHVCVCV